MIIETSSVSHLYKDMIGYSFDMKRFNNYYGKILFSLEKYFDMHRIPGNMG